MRLRDFARGLMVGGIAAYFLDRTRGHQRRAALRDKVSHFLHEIDDAAGKTARDARNRREGLRAAATARLDGAQVDDVVLHERVRSALGRVTTHPGSIEVGVSEGHVSLRGPILAGEVRRLLSAVRRVRGVRAVTNLLTEHASAEGVSALQGGRRRESRFEFRQSNWSPAARLFAGLMGAAALGSRDLPSPLRGIVRLLGLGMVARAVTNLELKRLVGVNAGRRNVDIQKTITVAAPVEQVFDFFSRFENFPLFMSHLKEVQRTGERTSHWVAQGPAGTEFHWDAEITQLEPNRRLTWRSADGATIKNAGVVNFEPAQDGGTRLDIHLCYNPPAGAIGHGLASLLGVDPKHAMDDDLVRFKSLIEKGRATADGTTVMREEMPGESIRIPRRPRKSRQA
jgi:uncharacterized membrane protein